MLKSKASSEASNTTSKLTTLNDLPVELLMMIGSYLSIRDIARLCTTNKTFHWVYSPTLIKPAAAQLMAYILKPTRENIKKAKAMIDANPKLIFIETTGVEWASGVHGDREVARVVKGSPFKAAIGAGDQELYNFMAQYLDKIVYMDEKGVIIETGRLRAQKQIQEQYPNGFDYPQVENEFTVLMDKIIGIITRDISLKTNNIPSPETRALLNEFRQYFLPKEVTQGHHFNFNYLIDAFDRYGQNCKNWKKKQQSYFWCQVIGYLERLVSGVDAQAFCQGLIYFCYFKHPPTRFLALHRYQPDSSISYFPTNSSSPSKGLGFDFGIFVHCEGCEELATGGREDWRSITTARSLKSYIEYKNRCLTTLKNTLINEFTQQPEKETEQPTNCCTIL